MIAWPLMRIAACTIRPPGPGKTDIRSAVELMFPVKVAAVQVSWRCQNSGTRFRCDMTSAGGVYATDLQLVALNCTALTELPAGSPPTLIRASGFESA